MYKDSPFVVAGFLVALVVSSLLVSADARAGGVEWKKGGLTKALASAKAGDKVVMVDVFADWCGPCHRLDKEVFSRADVAVATKGAVSLKIDGEKGEGPGIVERYHVVGYPTILFLNSRGEEIDRVFGFMEAESFKRVAANFISGKMTLASLREGLETTPGDNELRFEVGKRLVIRGELEVARPILKPIFEDDRENKAGYVPAIHHLLGKYGYLRGRKDHKKAAEHLSAIIEKFPKSPEAANAPYILAKAYHGQGKAELTFKTFDIWISTDPKAGAGRHNAVAWFCFKNDFELERAIAVAQRGLKIDPGAAYLWDTLAEIHFKKGDAASAISAIKRAISLAPKDQYYKDQLKRFGQ